MLSVFIFIAVFVYVFYKFTKGTGELSEYFFINLLCNIELYFDIANIMITHVLINYLYEEVP